MIGFTSVSTKTTTTAAAAVATTVTAAATLNFRLFVICSVYK